MVTEVIDKIELDRIFAAMRPQNSLVCKTIAQTGLRIGDVLNLRTAQLRSQRVTVREEKTGKARRVYLRKRLLQELRSNAGSVWVFPGRDPDHHRTRQAVWADMKRVCRQYGIDENLAPHSLRKIAAIERLRKTGDLMAVQKMLNHNSIGITMIYALADQLQRAKKKKAH